MTDKVTIVIVNWNGWLDTIDCLESVLRLDYPDTRVVVCDNGSTDGSLERLGEWAEKKLAAKFAKTGVSNRLWTEVGLDEAEGGGEQESDPWLVIVDIGKNMGFGAGNNVGIRYALARDDCSYVWLLNNDTVVHPAALAALVRRMKEKEGAGMCGSTLLYHSDPTRVQALGGACYIFPLGLAWHLGRFRKAAEKVVPEEIERRMSYVVGASLLVSCDLIRNIGLLEEDYFLFFEEIDWAMRARGSYSLAYAPGSVVYHKVGQSVGTHMHPRRKSLQCDYYTLRNRLIFTRRYRPAVLSGVYLVLAAEMLLRILVGRWDLARMIFMLLREGPAGRLNSGGVA